MSTILSPSSPSPQDYDHIPTATLAIPAPASAAAASRRLPPPCWSPEETVALIDAYRDKWYSLRRGNLRANHWQEVADDVGSRCPVHPAKTVVQCRHKMEKLRKRYRTEIQRAAAHGGVHRFTSSWVHFQSMHSMEKGPNPSPPSSDDEDEDDHKNGIKRINDLYNYNQIGVFGSQGFDNNGATSGFRIKIPGDSGPSAARAYSKFNGMSSQYPNNPNPRITNTIAGLNGAAFSGKDELGKKGSEDDGEDDVAAAIHALGHGFMRVENAKMDMVRQVEEMRMEMELKRTEMILESQHKIVEAFAKAISEGGSKKAKRNSTS